MVWIKNNIVLQKKLYKRKKLLYFALTSEKADEDLGPILVVDYGS